MKKILSVVLILCILGAGVMPVSADTSSEVLNELPQLLKMLEMYEKMYDDVQNEQTQKVNLVKSAFDNNMAMIKDSDMETQDKFAALGYVTDKIAELVEKIVVEN